MNKTASNIDGADEEERKSAISGIRSNTMSKSRTDIAFSTENFKYEIPETCHVTMMKKVVIEKLDQKYCLVAHPYPMVEGQMMIFQPKKADQKDSDLIVYRDYSLRKRIETSMKVKENKLDKMSLKQRQAAAKEKQDKKGKPVHEPKLQCLEIDIETPLTDVEWRNFAEVVDEVDGVGWFQVLPVGQKSSTPYQFNMLHVLPGNKLPVKKLPIDTFIDNKISYRRKKDKLASSQQAKFALANEELDTTAAQQGLLIVNEFEFSHCI